MPKTDKPNILVIWGDDIGIANLSCYSHGLMGYQTPNIDRLAKEGMMFTDSYGEQSCTAGRSSFITGQSVYRTGLSKVGIPGRADRHEREDSSPSPPASRIRAMRPASSARTIWAISTTCCRPITGSMSFSATSTTSTPKKSRNCPTIRTKRISRTSRRRSGRAASSTPGRRTRTTRPTSRAGARSASRKSRTPARSPRSGWRPATTISPRAPRNSSRRPNDAGKPFFVWLNFTHMHLFTHTKPESKGQAGRWQSPYHDTMIDHDKNVGQMLDYLDELGIADNTFVMYSTDNGPHMNSWPDGGMTPFRSEKNTNWEGAFRVPMLVRWPGKIKPGQISNEIVQHHDWLPTFLAMAGDPDVIEKLKKGYKAIGRTYKNHHRRLQSPALPHRRGEKEPAQVLHVSQRRRRRARLALRQLEGRVHGAALPRHAAGLGGAVHPAPVPKIFNLRTDPYERADLTSNSYYDWYLAPRLMICTARRRRRGNGRRPSRISRRFRSPIPSPSTMR